MVAKGAELEELVRAYFARQGFYALRGVSLDFEGEQVTDIDVWLYGRQSASLRTRSIVDVKDKRSPKAFERIMWTRGMQLALGCDKAIVATTDSSPKVARFAQQQTVDLLSKEFLQKLEKRIDTKERLTMEQFGETIRQYAEQKQDGDWLGRMSDAKSAVVSLSGYPAFNVCMTAFGFFASRAETRPQHFDQAIRCVYHTASLACIALDMALGRVVYEDSATRSRTIATGVTYGDNGDARVQHSIKSVLAVIAEAMPNGKVIARQAQDAMETLFANVRADIVAEFFGKEHNAATLFNVGRELDDRAYAVDTRAHDLSIEAKSVLGVFADFVQAKRSTLFHERASGASTNPPNATTGTGSTATPQTGSQAKLI